MGGILKGLFGSLVATPRSGAGPQQPLSVEEVLHDEAKPIHDVDLSDRPDEDPHQAQNKPDSAGLLGSLVGTPTGGAGPQQPLSIEQALHDEAKPIHDVDLSDRPDEDPHQAQNKPDSAEWQPIVTAPVNRDLEVRVADPMGHYALMCPCKLNPEQGWINSWLQTPLSHHPVEWREWTEPLVKY
jgi:hypothetical protein